MNSAAKVRSCEGAAGQPSLARMTDSRPQDQPSSKTALLVRKLAKLVTMPMPVKMKMTMTLVVGHPKSFASLHQPAAGLALSIFASDEKVQEVPTSPGLPLVEQ